MNIDISNNTQVSQNNYAECKSDHKKKKKKSCGSGKPALHFTCGKIQIRRIKKNVSLRPCLGILFS